MTMTVLERALAEAASKRRLPSHQICRHIREQAGVTQTAVAHAIGIHRASVARYEAGTRVPRGETLHRYVAVLERLLGQWAS
jgi:transcriptional regulator with XRE-family HTH domain